MGFSWAGEHVRLDALLFVSGRCFSIPLHSYTAQPYPLGALGAPWKFVSSKAPKRIAAIPKGPSAPRRSAPPGLQGPLWAACRKKRDDAFLWGSLFGPPACFRSAIRPLAFAKRFAARRGKLALLAVLTRFEGPAP